MIVIPSINGKKREICVSACYTGRRGERSKHSGVGVSSEPKQRGHLVGCRQTGVREQRVRESEETASPRPSQCPHRSRTSFV